MNQQSRPPRAARHRSSVYGPPPGVDPGTGYTTSAPFTSSSRRDRELQFPIPPTAPVSSSTNPHNSYTAPLNIDRISSPLSSRNIVRRTGNARPDPNIYDPIDEPIRTPRSPRERRLQGASSNGGTSVMFYPSSTTISSETSTTREDHNEPLPFFRTDPFGAPRRVESPGRTQIPSQGDLSSSQTRTTSMRSSGVLGDGAIQVDSDSSDAESVSTDYSVERQIVRQVSTVRRGQAQIVRNPSLRRSVVPDVTSLVDNTNIRYNHSNPLRHHHKLRRQTPRVHRADFPDCSRPQPRITVVHLPINDDFHGDHHKFLPLHLAYIVNHPFDRP